MPYVNEHFRLKLVTVACDAICKLQAVPNVAASAAAARLSLLTWTSLWRERETDRDRQTETETDRPTDRQTETERDRERHTHTERPRQRQTVRYGRDGR